MWSIISVMTLCWQSGCQFYFKNTLWSHLSIYIRIWKLSIRHCRTWWKQIAYPIIIIPNVSQIYYTFNNFTSHVFMQLMQLPCTVFPWLYFFPQRSLIWVGDKSTNLHWGVWFVDVCPPAGRSADAIPSCRCRATARCWGGWGQDNHPRTVFDCSTRQFQCRGRTRTVELSFSDGQAPN